MINNIMVKYLAYLEINNCKKAYTSSAAAFELLGASPSVCENPTFNGWSKNMIFALEFQEYSFLTVSFPPFVGRHGPNSINSPVNDEHPGPPFNHRTSGSDAGLARDSKNQKKKCLSSSTSKYPTIELIKQTWSTWLSHNFCLVLETRSLCLGK